MDSQNKSSYSQLKSFLVGKPLSSEMIAHEKIFKWKALAVLSSDALSSVAYATEEVLIPLAAFTAAAVSWSIPIALMIALLLIIVTISYRQTIDAYPSGGGAYTVAKENLGVNLGLVAGASLLIDYILTVAVSVAAGVENIASAFPFFLEHKVIIGILIILIIMIFNLRGLKESANIFALPTYLFIGSFVVMILTGVIRLLLGKAVAVAPLVHETYPSIPIFLLLRAFSSGCAALTGIEAISNGIPIFKDPAQKNAKITMLWMSTILGTLFLSITLLSHLYGITPKEGETAVSLLAESIFGRNIFYYIIQGSTALILVLAANTSYADFPRLSSLLARDGFLPRQLSSLGDRLVFSNGVIGLSLSSIFLLILFNGDTHHLIPLYAVGVFLSFTLSQSGMIVHHLRTKHVGWKKSLLFNVMGAITTFIVLIVIGATKFIHGAWMVILLIPLFVYIFKQIKKHYLFTAASLNFNTNASFSIERKIEHTAIVPISGIHPAVLSAIQYAKSISKNPQACYVEINKGSSDRIKAEWSKIAPEIPLIILESPFRSVIKPILDYVDQFESNMDSDKKVTVIIPEFVTRKWYHKFLHNQTALILYAALRTRKNVIVTSVRYYL